MKLSPKDKQNLTKPIQTSISWLGNNAALHCNTQFTLETTVEENAEVSIYTLSLSAYITIKFTTKEYQLIQSRDVDNFSLKLVGQYTIAIDYTNDVYVITKKEWEPVNDETPDYETPDYETAYKVIKANPDIFSSMVDRENKAIFKKNRTISLLLRLVEYCDSNYSSVFLEWFEEHKEQYKEGLDNTYLQQYQQFEKKDMTDTGIPFSSAVAKEQPLLCVDGKQEPTIEPVVDKPQEVIEPVDKPLTHNSVINESVRLPDPIDELSKKLDSEGFFNEQNEEKTNKSIAWRRGQPEFRRKLLEAYKGRCVITGCSSEEALEAAHIEPYSKTKNNDPKNGILLRADIHTLFDCDLIGIDPDTMKVCVSPNLVDYHKDFNDKFLQLPEHLHLDIIEALRIRYKEYQERLGRYGK